MRIVTVAAMLWLRQVAAATQDQVVLWSRWIQPEKIRAAHDFKIASRPQVELFDHDALLVHAIGSNHAHMVNSSGQIEHQALSVNRS